MNLDALGRDLRDAVRLLGRRPVFFLVSTLSIAVGAGLNVGIYAVLRHVMFDSPLTAAAPDRFVRIAPGLSFPNYRDLRHVDLPIDLAAMQMGTLTWQRGETTRAIGAHVVSDNFFDTVGVVPWLGRTFGVKDAGADVVMLSYPFWARTFAADPTMIGRTLDLNGWPHTIVGVLPKGFAANPLAGGVVYVPIGSHVATALENRRAAQFDLIGRLHAGVSAGEALAALRLSAEQLEHAYPEINRGLARRLQTSPTDAYSLFMSAAPGRALLAGVALLYGLVGLVLLIACANVAGLLLVRADERRDDTAIRLALGASSGRLVQSVLLESFVIAAVGCLAGLALCLIASSVLQRTITSTATIDLTALSVSVPIGYCLALIPVVTLACGLASAARMSRFASATIVDSHRGGGHVSPRFRLLRGLVAIQMAVCFVLLIAGAFFIENVARLRLTDPGFEVDRIVSVDVRVPPGAAARDPLSIRTAIAAEPGVEAISWGSPIGPPFTEHLQRAATDATSPVEASTDIRTIGPRFFETMRIPLVRGRDLLDTDLPSNTAPARAPAAHPPAASAPALPVPAPAAPAAPAEPIAVVINESFAQRYLPGLDPIGQRFVRPENPDAGRPRQLLEVVGVARDAMARTIGESRVPVLYLPQPAASLTIRVRDVRDAADAKALAALHDRLRLLESPGTVIDVAPFADRIAAAIAPVRLITLLLGILGTIALTLASIGLYAVVSYVATRRTFEIGIRVALGATRPAIARLILRDGVRVVAMGSVLGGACAWIVARAAQRLIVGQTLLSPTPFVAVACVLLILGIAASLRPAQRAAAADPVKVLRQ